MRETTQERFQRSIHALIEAYDLSTALTRCKAYILLYPDLPTGYGLQAEILTIQQRDHEALEHSQQAIARIAQAFDPIEAGRLHELHGMILHQLRRPTDAIEAYARAITAYSSLPMAGPCTILPRALRAAAYAQCRRHHEALDELLALEPLLPATIWVPGTGFVPIQSMIAEARSALTL